MKCYERFTKTIENKYKNGSVLSNMVQLVCFTLFNVQGAKDMWILAPKEVLHHPINGLYHDLIPFSQYPNLVRVSHPVCEPGMPLGGTEMVSSHPRDFLLSWIDRKWQVLWVWKNTNPTCNMSPSGSTWHCNPNQHRLLRMDFTQNEMLAETSGGGFKGRELFSRAPLWRYIEIFFWPLEDVDSLYHQTRKKKTAMVFQNHHI